MAPHRRSAIRRNYLRIVIPAVTLDLEPKPLNTPAIYALLEEFGHARVPGDHGTETPIKDDAAFGGAWMKRKVGSRAGDQVDAAVGWAAPGVGWPQSPKVRLS